jgi:rhodanese-related sulfurtransferase
LSFLLENYNWLLLLAAIVSGGLLAWPMISRSIAGGGFSTAEAVRLVNREKAILLDVSEPGEYAAGHAIGARNVPLGQLESATSSKLLPSNKALPVVVLCPSGTRANRAVAILKKLGFDNARVLAGGLNAWRDANLPVEKSA